MIRSRYRRIVMFFTRVILSIIGWDLILPRLGLRGLSRRTRPERLRQAAVDFRALAVQMGGVMIKVGQFLSARLDVLPQTITDELAGLQDEVQPEPFEAVRQVLEDEMQVPLDDRFISFDQVPLASASIGQVHRAFLLERRGGEQNNGAPAASTDPDLLTPVVVKVQRPNIQQVVETDLSALRVVSRWIHYYPPIRRRANIPALLDEFSRTLYEEIDYLHEGKNAQTFAGNFSGQEQVRVPDVYWSHTTRRVLTLEEVQGIKITDYESIEAAGIRRSEVAQSLFSTYLKQIFEDRFFHADPHPGNLFVLPSSFEVDECRWRIVFVDFGMTGTISPGQLAALREMLIAVGTRDIPRLIRSYKTLGVLLPGADEPLLEKATQRVFERFWGKSTAEIVNLGPQEAQAFAKEFGSLLYEMPFQVPENLILLGRCLGILSGICTGLDPNFNVWTSIGPYVQRLVQSEGGGRSVLLQEALGIIRSLVSLPGRTSAVLQRIEQGRLEVQIPDMKNSLTRLEQRVNRLAWVIVFTALFAGAIQLYLAGALGLAASCAAGAVLALLWFLLGR